MTSRSPTELLFNGQQYRTRLPTQHPTEEPAFHREFSERQGARKAKMKCRQKGMSLILNINDT